MDTKKFEYLETIREAIVMGEFEDLDDYVEDIRERVQSDPDFAELFVEIKSKNYHDAVSLIDEFIYEDIESEFGNHSNEYSSGHFNGRNTRKTIRKMDGFREDPQDEISFEEFNEDDFLANTGFEEE